ncbi:NAD(P)-binding protein [Mollisia scopiformis]|uniref:NAD(P)-binding protein n=1 Tax=Mollisia scopiformis TaxID=149040 RepID=A0A194XNH6_MOLSC|nr:NAD(P)-binding protein [Mollisia scopiformis]KUJ21659.1 NAD(P)-binding protein [Mollisia scopiformis]
MPTWIVTGSNRGLGLEFVTQLAADPKNTIIAATRSISRDLASLDALKSKTKNLHVLECDTGSQDSITKFASIISQLLGKDAKIDFLLNNAGINANSKMTSLTMTADALTNHMNVNVMGPAKLVQVLEPHLQDGSVVMNMTSGLGSLGYNRTKENPECTVYAMSKAALNMLSVHQAAHLKRKGVRVVMIDPGWVKTDMGGSGAQLEKEESIGEMLRILNGIKDDDSYSGRFFLYDGSERPW